MYSVKPLIILCFTVLFSVTSAAFAEAVNPATVFDRTNFAEAQKLEKLLTQPEASIDYARTKLTIDKMIDPKIDIDANLRKIDAIVKTINAMLVADPTSMQKMLALKKYLYEAGAWNNFKPYQYDFTDPKGTLIKNKLLPNYLATKQGNCISMPLLFIILGQRLGIDVTASTAPTHLLVKYTDSESGQIYNLETTSGANFARDVWLQQVRKITDEALKNKIYLQKLSKRETVAIMATTLAEDYFDKQEFEKSMMISDVVLKYNKNDVDSMVRKGAVFYKLLAKNYPSKYPSPNLIPTTERPYYVFLDTNNRYWFEKAESLGWREPTKEDEQNYLKTVKQAADGATITNITE
jgi:regulator of sirC expression with transglutaminase-like and TPR domain